MASFLLLDVLRTTEKAAKSRVIWKSLPVVLKTSVTRLIYRAIGVSLCNVSNRKFMSVRDIFPKSDLPGGV